MFHSISRERVQALLAGGAQIVEVLEESQYRQAHLPGAIHLPAWELSKSLAAQLDASKPVVVYCFDTA
jgi:rhodanese-related sulfurtransferase